jgi:precorrin-6B methylase 2
MLAHVAVAARGWLRLQYNGVPGQEQRILRTLRASGLLYCRRQFVARAPPPAVLRERTTRLATDYRQLTENLSRFYDFTGKVVLFVGAGGRQLLDPATAVRKLIAVDKDAAAVEALKANLAAQGRQDSVEIITAAFEEVTTRADTVYFEFCLHEMEDPTEALRHAKSLAAEVVVYDHSPGSDWLFYVVEEEKVARSCAAMERFGIRRRQRFQAEQRFADRAELLAKVCPQGPLAVERAQRFAPAAHIVIRMSYELDLL